MYQKISVIIPVSRPLKAKKAIAAIEKQAYPKDFLEIIGVSQKGKLTPGKRRNLGAEKAKGEVLIFLDDDCLPQKGWLEENLRALKDKGVGAVGGMVQGRANTYFARCLDYSNFTFAQTKKRREMPLCAASLGMRKKVFDEVGGFNERMSVGEDTDLCLRLNKFGLKTVYEPRIRVLHDHGRETLGALLSYQYANGRIKGLTIERRYPDNPWFCFLKNISHPVIYGPFVLPFAILATLMAILVNLEDNPGIIYYSPGIFLGKLACQLGIFVWILRTLKKPLILA